jgi:hypothetical protein
MRESEARKQIFNPVVEDIDYIELHYSYQCLVLKTGYIIF